MTDSIREELRYNCATNAFMSRDGLYPNDGIARIIEALDKFDHEQPMTEQCGHRSSDGGLWTDGEGRCVKCGKKIEYVDEQEDGVDVELPGLAAVTQAGYYGVRYPNNKSEITWLPYGTTPETLEGIAKYMRSKQAAKELDDVEVTEEMVTLVRHCFPDQIGSVLSDNAIRKAIQAALAAKRKE